MSGRVDVLRDDRGFTLTETLVVMVLFALVGAIVTAASVTGLHHQTELQDRSDTLAQARTALERIDRDIRSANPVLSATGSALVLQIAEPTATRVMTYTAAGGQLSVSETDTPNAGGSPTTRSSVLQRNLVNAVSIPVFSYAPAPGYVAPSGSGVNATTCAMPSGSSYDPGCIGTVTVRLSIQPPSLRQPVELSDNGTDLRNAS